MGLGLLDIPVTVEIDLSGTAYGGTPTWTDVTGWVLTDDNGQEIQVPWGRSDWWSDVGAAQVAFTLNNQDGRFTPGLSSSPYHPNVRRRVRCRIRCDVTVPAGGWVIVDNLDGTADVTGPTGFVYDRGNGTALIKKGAVVNNGDGTADYTGSDVTTTVYLYDGLMDSWETTNTSGIFSLTSVSATDILGRYGTDVPLRSMLHEEILADLNAGTGGSYYPLDDQGPADPSQSSTFGDLLGSDFRLRVYNGAGGPPAAYQNLTGSADPAVTGVGMGGFYAYLAGDGAPIGIASLTGGVAIEILFTTTFTGYTSVLFGDAFDAVNIGVDTSGHIGDGTTVGPFVADGRIHQLVMINGDGWYLDGNRVGSASLDTLTSIGFNFVGTLFCFAKHFTPPSMDRFAAHLIAARSGFQGESTDQHAARLLTYRTTFGSVREPGMGTVAAHATDGVTLQQALYDTAAAEGSVVFPDGQARIVFRSRGNLFNPPTSLFLDAAQGQVETTTVYRDETQFVVNDVTVSTPAGADQRAFDQTSIDADGQVTRSYSLIVDSDAQAFARATWEVQVGVQEQTSATQLDANLFTMTDANVALALLQLQPLDVVTLQNMVAQTPTVEDFMAQGGTITVGVRTLRVSAFTTVVPAGDPY